MAHRGYGRLSFCLEKHLESALRFRFLALSAVEARPLFSIVDKRSVAVPRGDGRG